MLSYVNVAEGEKVPIFNTISIETASKCNRSCYFCPVGAFARNDELMPIETIHKLLDELGELKYKGRIEFYIYSEPVRDKRLPDIIQYARSKMKSACLMISTNGDYFKTQGDIWHLFECGLNQMQINMYSAYDGSGDPEQFDKGVRISAKRHELVQSWVDNLGEHHGLKQGPSVYLNTGPHKRICTVVNKYGVHKNSENKDVAGPNMWTNRSGLLPDFRPALTEPLKKHCVKPFRLLNINWKGDSILCCNDFYGSTNFGNIKDRHIEDIWNDVNFNIYRLKLQNKKRDCHLCETCDFNGGYYPHRLHPVTFGEEMDKEILEANLIAREDMFETPMPVPIAAQGLPRK